MAYIINSFCSFFFANSKHHKFYASQIYQAMHNFFKENFKFLVTDVVNGPDASSKCIRVRLNSAEPNNKGKNSKKRKERGDKPFDSRGSENWPKNVGKFLR